MPDMKLINKRLQRIEQIVNDEKRVKAPLSRYVGIDFGTADIVVIVTDEQGEPHAAFLEWAEVVRDGIVLDYWGATQIVKDLLKKTENRLGITIDSAITSYPPGTDPRTSKNVVEAAGLRVEAVIDEPSSVVRLLGINEGAVVDIGGGTTGIAVARDNKIIYIADEATGGRHISLTIAGNRKISFEQAEEMKIKDNAHTIMPIIQPVFEKMAEIIRTHIEKQDVSRIYLSGGTCCFEGIEEILSNEIPGKEIILPHNPLYLTPLAIASYRSI